MVNACLSPSMRPVGRLVLLAATARCTSSMPMPRAASLSGSTCTRTANFCAPNTCTRETPLTMEMRCASRVSAYIASNKFALALMDILTGPNASAANADALCEGVKNLKDEAAKTALTAVLQNPQFTTDQERLEAWYEQSMNRVTGWYKRTSQIRIYVLAAAVTLFMNADSLKILKTLWNNPTMSAVLVEDTKARLQKPSAVPENDAITTQERQLLGQVDRKST